MNHKKKYLFSIQCKEKVNNCKLIGKQTTVLVRYGIQCQNVHYDLFFKFFYEALVKRYVNKLINLFVNLFILI